MPNRVCVVADGFNLYHSLEDGERACAEGKRVAAALSGRVLQPTPPERLRWFDLYGLCRSLLSAIGGGATLESVSYFSAFATFRGPEAVARHQDYVTALTLTGVSVELAHFKRKEIMCPACRASFTRHEEKETDVAIAVKLLELATNGNCDTVLLISGDTDIVPAIRAARRLNPLIRIVVAFPYKRTNKDMQDLAHRCFELAVKHYRKWQLPNSIALPNGDTLRKPANY